MSRKYIRGILFVGVGLLLLVTLIPYMRTNLAHVLVSKAYVGTYSVNAKIDRLKNALLLTCKESPGHSCTPEAWPSDEIVVATVDRFFMNELGSMQIITSSVEVPISQFTPSGLPASLQAVETPSVLYGPGYFQLRTFFLAETENCWQFSVKAKHDDPAPVNLEIWLDDVQLDTLSYDKGDQSWGVLSTYAVVSPNAHWLRVWFANDYLDEDTGADRNAYVEHVAISRVEAAHCEND